MSDKPETDPDGVVGRDDETTEENGEVHENVREGTEGVETPGDGAHGGDSAANGLIGNGAMTDPRYLAQR